MAKEYVLVGREISEILDGRVRTSGRQKSVGKRCVICGADLRRTNPIKVTFYGTKEYYCLECFLKEQEESEIDVKVS
jgi:hypothetical protein